MTRGAAYIFYEDGFMHTTEFNGDMYPGGCGNDMYQLLSQAIPETFEKFMNLFNSRHHDYPEQIVYREEYNGADAPWINKGESGVVISFENYYNFWFSDYVFVKNWTTKQINVKQQDGGITLIPPGQVRVFNYGERKDGLAGWEKEQRELFKDQKHIIMSVPSFFNKKPILATGLYENKIYVSSDRIRQALGTPTAEDKGFYYWALQFNYGKAIECIARKDANAVRFDAFDDKSIDWSDEFKDYILSLELLDEMTVED